MNNHILCNVDTDSFSVCKHDQSPWTLEEKQAFQDYINSFYPEQIKWCDDGEYSKFLVIKSKNYVMIDSKGKRKIKGSALKDSKKPKAASKFMLEMVDLLLEEKTEEMVPLYEKYVKEIMTLTDISPWCKKLTVTEKITRCKGHEKMDVVEKSKLKVRANETKVWDAIKHTDFQEGDKVYVHFKADKSYGLSHEFTGDYDKKSLLLSLYSSVKIFKNVLDMSKFINYSLKRNNKQLQEILIYK